MDGLMHVPKGRPSNSTTGLGWRMYAAAMLTLSASVNVVWGIIALWSNYYWGGDSAASGQPELWGWLFIVIAVVQLSIVGLILIGSGLGLLLGIGVAGTNAILHLHLVDSHQGWAVVAIGADLLVIYALARPWFRPG
jgi:hypothetical protein